MGPKNIIVATGGTAGHIFPAISVGLLLKERGYDVLFIGNRSIEEYLGSFDFSYELIESPKEPKKLRSLFSLLKGIWQSFKIFRKFRPDAVIGFGGYTTIPTLLMAKFMGIKIYIHEQNLYVGDTNRFFLKYARCVFTSLQEIYGISIDYKDRVYFTGNPVRREIKELYNLSDFQYPKEDETFNILITGGSGGSSFLATELLKAFRFLKKETKHKIHIFHQVKREEEIEIATSFYEKEAIVAEVKLFFKDLVKKILQSHLIICRAGMGTSSELAAIGRPAIFIPSPNVKNNHQLHNAKFFERSGACLILEESNFSPESFASSLESLMGDREKLLDLASNMKKLAITDAEEKIVNYIDDDII
ncbi:MAG: undecaprenyldiphospho-muramoylpentapeptide beta-N-acetylglucosaminyltransferase [Rickettsiales bacterium]|jgi:UDP-N-acetylglucosamine--N-acetylmuramyl-(pentapeptide) pyrophosphoryl-undecaprenol N-acetylglucosamine transferase|nr:undecaprenyldiphospho-muramoylpentapeptide beta-N-acetylglucosaminyltransferase [Rickettsiales bacterium]